MSDGPLGVGPAGAAFAADAGRARRFAELADTIGPAVERDLAAARTRGDLGVVPAREVAALIARHGLADAEELMLLALPSAAALARPSISRFLVGAVGLEAGSGDLLLGGNVEFPGTSLGLTIHGEGAVALRATGRGSGLTTLALTRATPCAHCRQVLAEFAWGRWLRLVDPAGHAISLGDLYPWPFAPEALGMRPAGADADDGAPGPGLAADADADLPPAVAERLVAAGRRAHAPYSGARAAVVAALPDGTLVDGAVLESVAYNPSIGPLQAAIPEVIARGSEPADIEAAWLAVPARAVVDHEASTRWLLAATAPGASLRVVHWA